MSLYIYQHPQTGEIKEVSQKMEEKHVYIDEQGTRWDRVFVSPRTSTDTKINPHSCEDFLKKTSKKRGTVGDLWDISEELSRKREKELGKDPVKEKRNKDYRKRCKKPHPYEKAS